MPCKRFPKTWRRAGAALTIVLALLVACRADHEDTPDRPLDAYAVPLRSDSELQDLLVDTCQSARRGDNPRVLVEFSAAWCGDCRKLHEMKQAAALARELEAWPSVTVNVGRFDRHRDLLDALAITSIAHWSVFEPTDCEAALPGWPRRAARTLEVSSGDARRLTPRDLADWLAALRTG